MAIWKTQLAVKLDGRTQVSELYVKSRKLKEARRQATAASIMTRPAAPSFLPELRLQIIESLVWSQVPCWPAAETDCIQTLAAECFIWPKTVTDDVRSLLSRIAEQVLFDACIFKLKLEFAQPHVFAIPPSLDGRFCNIRRLVLELVIVPRHGAYHREINRGIEGMSELGVLFPRLKVCVVMLHVRSMHVRSIGAFVNALSKFRNIRRAKDSLQWEHEPLEESIVDLIASFLRCGPGRRKLVRLSREGFWRRAKEAEPLIEARDSRTIAEEHRSSKGLDMGVESPAIEQSVGGDLYIAEARHIFDRALSAQVNQGDKSHN